MLFGDVARELSAQAINDGGVSLKGHSPLDAIGKYSRYSFPIPRVLGLFFDNGGDNQGLVDRLIGQIRASGLPGLGKELALKPNGSAYDCAGLTAFFNHIDIGIEPALGIIHR